MVSQIFKQNFNNEILYNFLEEVAIKKDKCYIINNSVYKRAKYHNLLDSFYESLQPYYHSAKLFYLNRDNSYPRFITIIRQICKFKSISWTSEIKYNKSKYDINYYIYF